MSTDPTKNPTSPLPLIIIPGDRPPATTPPSWTPPSSNESSNERRAREHRQRQRQSSQSEIFSLTSQILFLNYFGMIFSFISRFFLLFNVDFENGV